MTDFIMYLFLYSLMGVVIFIITTLAFTFIDDMFLQPLSGSVGEVWQRGSKAYDKNEADYFLPHLFFAYVVWFVLFATTQVTDLSILLVMYVPFSFAATVIVTKFYIGLKLK